MSQPFQYFVVFAEMRTGSNFLEANLNAMPGVTCFGEAFNPHFIGYPNKTEILGLTQPDRDANPERLISRIQDEPGLIGGFRFFHDHDPRALELILNDPSCAKIILTRNPLDSYVSWKIAQQTGQWKLTNVKRRREALATFDADEFSQHVENAQKFQLKLLNGLQRSGQTAFYVAYEDLQDLEVINGLGAWLGAEAPLTELDNSLKPQNPQPVLSKVENPEAVVAALSGIDRFNLTRTPNFEPRRGGAIPSYVAGVQTGLLYMPIRSGPEAAIAKWLADLDNVAVKDLPQRMNQRDLRKWMREQPRHRSFTVLRHPVARAHHAFCTRILHTGPGSFLQIRQTLRKQFKLPIPKDGPNDGYTRTAHRKAFGGFLDFLKMNLSGQTPVRVDAVWCSQAQVLEGFSDFAPPDYILREDEVDTMLPWIAQQAGHAAPPIPPVSAPDQPYPLEDIYDDEIEELVANIYQRDYLLFGFGQWTP
jgi:LPS sulfotransferase NodH